MKLTEEEKIALEKAETPEDYNLLCDSIKKKGEGRYPEDWYAVVMAPHGIHSRLAIRWKDPDAFRIKVGPE